jgi:hypothetical protein
MFGCELQRRLVLKDYRVGAFQETSIRRSPNSMRMISGHSATNQLNSDEFFTHPLRGDRIVPRDEVTDVA